MIGVRFVWPGLLLFALGLAAAGLAPAAEQTPPSAAAAEGEKPANDLESVRKRLREEQARTEEQSTRVSNLLADMRLLDSRLLSSGHKLAALKEEEAALERDYREHAERIKALEEKRTSSRTMVNKRLASIYKQGRLGSARVLEQAAASTEPLRMARYLAAISKADSEAMARYEGVRERHETALVELRSKKETLATKKEALRKESARYEVARKEKAGLLAGLKKDLEVHRSEAERLRTAEKELQSILALAPLPEPPPAPRVSPRREVEESRGRRRDDRPFRQRKGSLDAPVRGDVVTRFGQRRTGGAHVQGIIVRAPSAGRVRAVAAGEVVFSGPFPGLGSTVIVSHGDRYHTVYAHLSEIYREVGQQVSEGEAVGNLTEEEPLLHFELRAEGKPLDPKDWLKGGYSAFR